MPFIRTYYQLTADETEAFRNLLRQEHFREVSDMELTYYGKMAREATEQGLQQGLQQGMQRILLQQLETKFGELPPSAVDEVRAIQSTEGLTALATKVLTANSLADLGLDGAS